MYAIKILVSSWRRRAQNLWAVGCPQSTQPFHDFPHDFCAEKYGVVHSMYGISDIHGSLMLVGVTAFCVQNTNEPLLAMESFNLDPTSMLRSNGHSLLAVVPLNGVICSSTAS